MPEHDQRALEALGDVGLLHQCAIQLGVGADRADQLGDPVGRLTDLAQQAHDGQRAGHPLQARLELTRAQPGRGPFEERHVGPGRRERGRDDPVAVDVVPHEPVGQLLLAIGDAEGVELLPFGGDVATQRVERDELLRRSSRSPPTVAAS